jgi:hypothetical protein
MRIALVFDSSGEWQPSLNARTLSERTLNVQGAADASHPLAHRVQPKVAGEGTVRVEAAAVIPYPQNRLGADLLEG